MSDVQIHTVPFFVTLGLLTQVTIDKLPHVQHRLSVISCPIPLTAGLIIHSTIKSINSVASMSGFMPLTRARNVSRVSGVHIVFAASRVLISERLIW